MSRMRFLALLGFAAAGALSLPQRAEAGGGHPRTVVGGHPYHNGNYFVPPSSAYESTRIFPPARYGFPAYYVPSSYLPAGMASPPPYGYPTWPAYNYIQTGPRYGYGPYIPRSYGY